MPDDAKPQPPLDLSLDFETLRAKPADPVAPAAPIDLDWFEPTPTPKPPAVTPASAPPVESLPEAVLIPVVTPAVRPAGVARPAARPMQANPAPEFRKERPAKSRPLLASVVVLVLMLATAVAVLVLMGAIYKGFQVFGKPRTTPTTAPSKR